MVALVFHLQLRARLPRELVVVVPQRILLVLVGRVVLVVVAAVEMIQLLALMEPRIPVVAAVVVELELTVVQVVLVWLSFVTKSRRQYGALRTSY
jgi:hypothetical protein